VERSMNTRRLQRENADHAGTAGVSERNRHLGFRPAFLDPGTMQVHESRFANGRLAPFHLLDGLPDEVVLLRSPSGRVLRAKPSLVSGFLRAGFFYTRAAAARAASDWP
jgi:hypothetical protein